MEEEREITGRSVFVDAVSFGLQENNEDCRFHKCGVTQR